METPINSRGENGLLDEVTHILYIPTLCNKGKPAE